MFRDVLGTLGFCVFVYVLYALFLKIFCGEWIWQAWKRKKRMEKELERWLKEEDCMAGWKKEE